jgi:hypothetical protein
MALSIPKTHPAHSRVLSAIGGTFISLPRYVNTAVHSMFTHSESHVCAQELRFRDLKINVDPPRWELSYEVTHSLMSVYLFA